MAFIDCMLDNMSLINSIRIPFLTLHGKDDKLCNVVGSRYLCQNASSEDIECVEYDSANHQLYLEVPNIREDSINKTVEWVNERIQREP